MRTRSRRRIRRTRRVLEGAERQLKDNPDRAEIVADSSRPSRDKCRRFLGPHKTVVAASEVEQIIAEMGPVGGGGRPRPMQGACRARRRPTIATSRSDGAGAPGTRRLYLIHEGSMIAGVCSGLAAYLHMDVTVLRIVVIALTLLTKGGFALVYLVLAFVIPPADTSGATRRGARTAFQCAGINRSSQGALRPLQGQERLAQGLACRSKAVQRRMASGKTADEGRGGGSSAGSGANGDAMAGTGSRLLLPRHRDTARRCWLA